jgi:S-adenosylmethionine:tRNA ribosyltransferase-isomerase
MQLSDFHYELPAELIAAYPTPIRTDSRLFCLNGKTGALAHKNFFNITELLEPGDLLVFNNTRVIPARVYGHKLSGGKIEILIERLLADSQVLAHIKASKAPKPASQLFLEQNVMVTVIERQNELYRLQFPQGEPILTILERIGHIPLPPYIERTDEAVDVARYQTVYATSPGAVAAPTAGLHFDDSLLEQLKERGVNMGFVTLHVGAGTFQPVRVEDITQHRMHAEYIQVSTEICEQIKATKAAGRRVIAVGTTSVRCLETAAASGEIYPFAGDTNIFIYPGYTFHCVDALITNFHLPGSTLLMLVCAFAGYEHVMKAYEIAIKERYRFFSYGDAMWITS